MRFPAPHRTPALFVLAALPLPLAPATRLIYRRRASERGQERARKVCRGCGRGRARERTEVRSRSPGKKGPASGLPVRRTVARRLSSALYAELTV
eukprot:2338293-Rhodomonas_salina.5